MQDCKIRKKCPPFLFGKFWPNNKIDLNLVRSYVSTLIIINNQKEMFALCNSTHSFHNNDQELSTDILPCIIIIDRCNKYNTCIYQLTYYQLYFYNFVADNLQLMELTFSVRMSVHMDHHTGATASLMLQNALQWTIVLKSGSSNQW